MDCLFVAAGESALAAPAYRDFGHVVTLNAGITLFDRVDLALLSSPRSYRDLLPHLHKAERIWSLVKFPIGKEQISPALIGKTEFPAYTKSELAEHTPSGIVQHIRSGKLHGKACIGLHCLHAIGYRRFWLFGHDGGTAYIPDQQPAADGYDFCRLRTATWCEYMAETAGIEYWFWPDRPR